MNIYYTVKLHLIHEDDDLYQITEKSVAIYDIDTQYISMVEIGILNLTIDKISENEIKEWLEENGHRIDNLNLIEL